MSYYGGTINCRFMGSLCRFL